MSDMVKDWLAECTDGRVSKQTQQILEAFANWQAAAIAAMQADAAPVAWMYERGPETIILQEQLHRDGVLRGVTGWTETPLYAHPPLTERETVAKIVAWLRGDGESDWFDPDCADAIEAKWGKQ